MKDSRFELVGIRPLQELPVPQKKRRNRRFPVLSAVVLGLILLGCLGCEWIMTKDPSYMDLAHCNAAPGSEFWFGTDTLGRDIFSMIWYGGRVSLEIGFLSTAISTVIAIVFGALSGVAPEWADAILMRFTEILLSIPNLLLIIFLQAVLGKANILSLSLVIGPDGMDEHRQSSPDRGKTASQLRICDCLPVHGRWFFSYPPETLDTEFYFIYYVHGSYEYPGSHRC